MELFESRRSYHYLYSDMADTELVFEMHLMIVSAFEEAEYELR